LNYPFALKYYQVSPHRLEVSFLIICIPNVFNQGEMKGF
jgi:hypothetical protein